MACDFLARPLGSLCGFRPASVPSKPRGTPMHDFSAGRRLGLAVAVLATYSLGACGGDPEASDPIVDHDPRISTESPIEALTEADFAGLERTEVAINLDWTRNRVTKPMPAGAETATLAEVSTEQLEGFDRIIFTFDARVPGYELVLGTEAGGGCDGTGDGTDTAAHLAVEFTGAEAPADGASGQAAAMASGFPALATAVQSCNADGKVRWLLGMAADVEFRIIEMLKIPRLVVDLRHPEDQADPSAP